MPANRWPATCCACTKWYRSGGSRLPRAFPNGIPPLAFQVPVQVRWMDVVGREFLHRRRLGGDVKSEDARFVPNGDRFDEGPVVKLQYRMAPTPVPSMVAQVG